MNRQINQTEHFSVMFPLVCGDEPHSTKTRVTCIFPLNLNCGADSWGGFILVVTSQIGEENRTREKKAIVSMNAKSHLRDLKPLIYQYI